MRHVMRRGSAALAAVCSTALLLILSAAPAGAASWSPPSCQRPASPVAATPVAGTPSDYTVSSFDGTAIRAHWFPVAGATPDHPAPTLLMGPGWGFAGTTDVGGAVILGGLSIAALHDAGYNVLTWDPRGFGASNGTITIDDPRYEGRDVSSLIDWISTLPGVQTDAVGDPRMGMVGGSYGGGIQFGAAGQDCRIDAIAPTVAWSSLVDSLDLNDTYKAGWAGILLALGSSHQLDAHITGEEAYTTAHGQVSAAGKQWYGQKDLMASAARIRVPTLIAQGIPDSLFPLAQGVDNYNIVKRGGAPVKMVWFCGGHGLCLTPPGDAASPTDAVIPWMNRWVKRDAAVQTGPGFTFVDQRGTRYSADRWPLKTGEPVTADGDGGRLSLVATGGSGPLKKLPAGVHDSLGGLQTTITATKATNAVDVPVRAKRPALVLGAPKVTLTYAGKVPKGPRPTRVFAQLVDDRTGRVVGSQITPIPVTLDGRSHTTAASLEMVVQSLRKGDRLTLQLVATTVAYAKPQLGGGVRFTRVAVSLPTVAPGATSVVK